MTEQFIQVVNYADLPDRNRKTVIGKIIDLDVTQEEVAFAAGIGRSTVGHIISGRRGKNMTSTVRDGLCYALGLERSDLPIKPGEVVENVVVPPFRMKSELLTAADRIGALEMRVEELTFEIRSLSEYIRSK